MQYNKSINAWAKNCLAVYIIYTHPLFWNEICELLQIKEISSLCFYSLFFGHVGNFIFCIGYGRKN